MDLDAKDTAILHHLQRDGRMSNADLAQTVNLSPSACLRRVRQLEEAGVIGGYAALIDPVKIGKSFTVFIEVSLNSQSQQSLDAFETAVQGCPEVLECHLMTGDADYLLRVAAADLGDFERIHKSELSRLPNVSRIRTSFSLRTVLKRTALDVGLG